MLTTKNVKTDGGSRKIIEPGKQKLAIRKIYLERPPYTNTGYNLVMLLESEPVGGEFEGLPYNKDKPTGPKFKGQVGRVKYSQYTYEDKTLSSGVEISRDKSILQAVAKIADKIGKREAVDKISAGTIEDYIAKVNKIISGNAYYYFLIGGKEYKSGKYINIDMYLPKLKPNESAIGLEEEDVLDFDPDVHINKLKIKEVEKENSDFELANDAVNTGESEESEEDDDFEFDF